LPTRGHMSMVVCPLYAHYYLYGKQIMPISEQIMKPDYNRSSSSVSSLSTSKCTLNYRIILKIRMYIGGGGQITPPQGGILNDCWNLKLHQTLYVSSDSCRGRIVSCWV